MKNLLIQVVILLAFQLAYFLRFGSLQIEGNYITALLCGLLVAAVVMPITGAFRFELRWDFLRKTRRLLAGWALVVTILITIAATLKASADYSRVWFGYWALITSAGLIASQLLEFTWQTHRKKQAKTRRRVALVCGGSNGKNVEQHILLDRDGSLELVARFGQTGSKDGDYPISELAEVVEREKIAEVWVALPNEATELLKLTLKELNELVVEVFVVPDLKQYRLLNQKIIEYDGLPVINLSGTPMTGTELRFKEVFDRVTALILLLALSPLFIFVTVVIRATSPGPALYRQRRAGIGGEVINIFKFRSMAVNDGKFTQATLEDNRVTTFGSLLRKTSLDELPQLINVLRGQMSLVGPRPHVFELNNQFMARIPRYMLRHKVKPGITGWAQVNGFRGITDTDDKMALRIEHDLWYIQNWSLWLDLKILLQTPLAMIHRNAF